MPMNPRLLRPTTSAFFPLAEARDSSNNVIAATDYTDGTGAKWRAHIFNGSGTLNFTKSGKVEYLVVAGGGGGGSRLGGAGGGGAGGLLTNVGGSTLAVTAQQYTITVGAGGGGGGSNAGLQGSDGNASSLGSLVVATGGGGGGARSSTQSVANGLSGGSGGGGGHATAAIVGLVGLAGAASPSGQGNAGGNASSLNVGGGGGGAGAAGDNATSTVPGKGGDGVSSSISGSSVAYAGGGGGSYASNPGASGGLGGGGTGGDASGSGKAGTNGTANTGGGGGGSGGNASLFKGGDGGSGIVIVRYRRAAVLNVDDPDVAAYLAAVQTADGQTLEPAVRSAIADFIVGCKTDGIWSAIKASCILMGARNLSGALTPLVGSAPTNNGPFVSGDYDRKTGLVGNGTSKYLDTNRANDADPQDSSHSAVYIDTADSQSGVRAYLDGGGTGNGANNLGRSSAITALVTRNRTTFINAPAGTSVTGFFGHSRSVSASYLVRYSGANSTVSVTSQAPSSDNLLLFARIGPTAYTNARLAFYSIGESIDLALLDTRVSALYTAIGNAIP